MKISFAIVTTSIAALLGLPSAVAEYSGNKHLRGIDTDSSGPLALEDPPEDSISYLQFTLEDLPSDVPHDNDGTRALADTDASDPLALEDPPEDSMSYLHFTLEDLPPDVPHDNNGTRALAGDTNPHHNEDIVIYQGNWGGWKPLTKIQKGGMYACGARMRFEDSVGGGDDTAANGLKLKYCGLNDWRLQEEQTIWDGNWGSWKNFRMCPYGRYIGAAQVRYEDPIGGGDDTALNGLAIWCVDKYWHRGQRFVVYDGLWGNWKSWGFKIGRLVKGARVRFEDSIGGGDDTAMNGIIFNVEEPNAGVSNSEITGTWRAVASGAQGQFSHKIIEHSETTHQKQITSEETYGFTQSISAGFKIKVVDVSVSVGASQSYRTAQTMSESLKVFRGTETTFACPTEGSPSGYYTMWQFVMSQEGDASGVGFNSETRHIRCTPSLSQPPKCVVGFCMDLFCQKCIE